MPRKNKKDIQAEKDEARPPRRRPEEGKGTPGKYANGEPPYQPTKKEIADRVEFARDVYLKRRFKGQMISDIKQEFGVSARTAEEYLSRAKAQVRELSDATWMEKRENAYQFYLSIAMDESQPAQARIKAQTRIDQIYGLDAPVKVARTDKDGNDITVDEAESRIDSLAARIAERGGDPGPGGSSPGN